MRYIPAILLFGAIYIPVCAQEHVLPDTFDIAPHTIQFPYHSDSQRLKFSVGLSMVKPPKDMLETAVQAPLANIHAVYKLPFKFSVEGDFTTLIVSNQLKVGPRFSIIHNYAGIDLGWDIAYVIGFLNQFGFNNSTHSWIHYPNISLGYKLKEIAFTLKAEAVIVESVSTRTGDNELTTSRSFLNGYTGALYIEQRLHKNKIFVFGIKDNYVKYYWPTWMVFSTFNRYYNIPELYFSWVFGK